MDHHLISEYIENLPLKATFCRGYKPNDVYEVIYNLSSMYNELLSEACKEAECRSVSRPQILHAEAVAKEGEQRLDYTETENLSLESPDESVVLQMTDKEVSKLTRKELLEILLEQNKEKDLLQQQLKEKNHMISVLNKKLEEREIHLKEAGTIADAAFKLNGVYGAVERAAEQYLDNLQRLYEEEKVVYEQKEKDVNEKCQALIDATYRKCDALKNDTVKACKALMLSTEKNCKEKEAEAEEKSRMIIEEAKLKAKAEERNHADGSGLFSSESGDFEELMTFLKQFESVDYGKSEETNRESN